MSRRPLCLVLCALLAAPAARAELMFGSVLKAGGVSLSASFGVNVAVDGKASPHVVERWFVNVTRRGGADAEAACDVERWIVDRVAEREAGAMIATALYSSRNETARVTRLDQAEGLLRITLDDTAAPLSAEIRFREAEGGFVYLTAFSASQTVRGADRRGHGVVYSIFDNDTEVSIPLRFPGLVNAAERRVGDLLAALTPADAEAFGDMKECPALDRFLAPDNLAKLIPGFDKIASRERPATGEELARLTGGAREAYGACLREAGVSEAGIAAITDFAARRIVESHAAGREP